MTDPILEPEDYTSYGDVTSNFVDDLQQDDPTPDHIEEDYSIKAWEQALSERLYNQQVAYEQSLRNPRETI
jgi:hypothetical protein